MKVEVPIDIISKASIDLRDLAQVLAGETDVVQADFFNEFDAQLRSICRSGFSMQCLYIRKYLNTDCRSTLTDLGVDEYR